MEIEKLKMKDSKEKEDEIQKIEEDESTVLDFSVKNDQVQIEIIRVKMDFCGPQ